MKATKRTIKIRREVRNEPPPETHRTQWKQMPSVSNEEIIAFVEGLADEGLQARVRQAYLCDAEVRERVVWLRSILQEVEEGAVAQAVVLSAERRTALQQRFQATLQEVATAGTFARHQDSFADALRRLTQEKRRGGLVYGFGAPGRLGDWVNQLGRAFAPHPIEKNPHHKINLPCMATAFAASDLKMQNIDELFLFEDGLRVTFQQPSGLEHRLRLIVDARAVPPTNGVPYNAALVLVRGEAGKTEGNQEVARASDNDTALYVELSAKGTGYADFGVGGTTLPTDADLPVSTGSRYVAGVTLLHTPELVRNADR